MAAAWEENEYVPAITAANIEAESKREAARRAALTSKERLMENIRKGRKFYPERRIRSMEALGQAPLRRAQMLAEIRGRDVKKPVAPLSSGKRAARTLRLVGMPNFAREGITEFLRGARPYGTLPPYGSEAIRRKRASAVRRGNAARAKSKANATRRMFPKRRQSRARSAPVLRSQTRKSRPHSR